MLYAHIDGKSLTISFQCVIKQKAEFENKKQRNNQVENRTSNYLFRLNQKKKEGIRTKKCKNMYEPGKYR